MREWWEKDKKLSLVRIYEDSPLAGLIQEVEDWWGRNPGGPISDIACGVLEKRLKHEPL